MVNVHIITIVCTYMYKDICIHIWQIWSSDPGEGRMMELQVIVGKLTRKCSSPTQPVDIRGFIIMCKFNESLS